MGPNSNVDMVLGAVEQGMKVHSETHLAIALASDRPARKQPSLGDRTSVATSQSGTPLIAKHNGHVHVTIIN